MNRRRETKSWRRFEVMAYLKWMWGALALAALSACGQSSVPNSTSSIGSVPVTRYDLANGCFALKSVAANAYAVRGDDGSYAATSPAASGGEPLYVKPAALGKYFFYAKDQSFCAASGSAVG